MDERIISTLAVLAVDIPLYIVWLVGLILAIINWKKMPKVSLLTVIAIVILFLVNVAGTIFSMNYSITAYQNGVPSSQIAIVLAIVGFTNVLFVTASWGMLLAAIFGWRKPAA